MKRIQSNNGPRGQLLKHVRYDVQSSIHHLSFCNDVLCVLYVCVCISRERGEERRQARIFFKKERKPESLNKKMNCWLAYWEFINIFILRLHSKSLEMCGCMYSSCRRKELRNRLEQLLLVFGVFRCIRMRSFPQLLVLNFLCNVPSINVPYMNLVQEQDLGFNTFSG